MIDNDQQTGAGQRRRAFLRDCTGAAASAGALTLMAGCGDTYGADAVADKIMPTPPPTAAPTYSATDTDYLNFLLQIQYLTAGFFWRSAFGGSIDPALVTGSGTAGSVTGGAQVQFADELFMQGLREIALEEVARIGQLRTLIGTGVTAQPAITIGGGAGSPFDAIASQDAFPGSTPFDPYASLEQYLLGSSGLSWLATSAFRGVAFRLTGAANRDTVLGLLAGKAHHDTFLRLAVWRAGLQNTALYGIEDKMVLARNALNGGNGTNAVANYENGVGSASSTTIVILDIRNANSGALLARTPDQVLNIAYAAPKAVASGGFFPAGVNGLIKYSNAAT
ncbi:ferritin-like domain-containing protein [Sphingomonas sp. RIT328]|uniref:ferritin-like domain-containing protein n=1 Tax=Sphingomonas sp. RIT328 TaxID=1470591 RepID=UPI0004522BA8|nr:ferritin-like domain-containing protein [Sphingomonas sp. RIT328]EZP50459.1 hypothetical protein BW41_03130 [Sphingomonas sp. RIT328]